MFTMIELGHTAHGATPRAHSSLFDWADKFSSVGSSLGFDRLNRRTQ
jgi:hypothetical protein